MSKIELRRAMRARLRETITSGVRVEKSRVICEAISRHPAYLQARTIALFDAMPSEPEVALLWGLAPRRFVYPRIHGVELLLIEVASRDELLRVDGVKFREPAQVVERILDPAEVELILVPGLAFTRDGRRLGRGGGYYDRLLARLPAGTPKFGVCFDAQLVPDLPSEPHDQRVDVVWSG